MSKNYKKDILSQIVDGGVYGAPTGGLTVKFQYATDIAKAATDNTPGALTFACDSTNGLYAIYANGSLVSSAIQKVDVADKISAKHGAKTVTVTYIVAATGASATTTFDVIDEAALEAYFTNSKTIALDVSTGKYEVRLVENGGLKVNENGGLEVELGDVVNVDGKTIVSNDVTDPDTQKVTKGVLSTALAIKYVGAGDATKARIALFDKNGADGANELSAVEVEDIISSGIVKSTSYDPDTNILTITWDSDPATTTEIDLSKLLDVLNDVVIDTSSANYMTATADTSIMKLGLTQKSRDAIDAAETALQTITSANDYLIVGAKTGDANQKTVALTVVAGDLTVGKEGTADSTLSGTANTLAKSNDTATKVQSFVNARISEEIAKLDSSAATAELSAATGVYVKVEGDIVDGKFNTTDGLKVSTLNASTAVTDFAPATTEPAADAVDPTITFPTAGLLSDKDGANIVKYVDEVAKSIKAKGTDSLNAELDDNDTPNFIHVGVEQDKGLIKNLVIDSSYGAYGTVTRDAQNVATAAAATDGIAKVGDTQTWVMGIINDLNYTATDATDASSFVKTTISETDGIVKNNAVEVTYATVTAAPGTVTVDTNGIVKGDVLKTTVEGALTWIMLS